MPMACGRVKGREESKIIRLINSGKKCRGGVPNSY